MNEVEKQELAKSIKARYGKRFGFKNLFNRANREIYKEDILQPHQRKFRDVFQKQYLIREASDREGEYLNKKNEKELDEYYRAGSKHVLTTEQKTLKELREEHPTLVKEEDIIKWPTTSTQVK
ncbi:MAG: hypothetical protein AAB922_01340 [Patescibacteria group bacterium]